ncbi:hypothetical protein [Aliiroseovarius marinus]|uniref:hypothetical protein n=1 Tax=Aliiroseovarius marinus TaxID=2500159 RepID=UPI003D7E116B
MSINPVSRNKTASVPSIKPSRVPKGLAKAIIKVTPAEFEVHFVTDFLPIALVVPKS